MNIYSYHFRFDTSLDIGGSKFLSAVGTINFGSDSVFDEMEDVMKGSATLDFYLSNEIPISTDIFIEHKFNGSMREMTVRLLI